MDPTQVPALTIPPRTERILAEGDEQPRTHRFAKKNFDHPTWCIFSNKFIWGLEKTGYACVDCGMVCSRKYIVLAKQTACGYEIGLDVVSPSAVNPSPTQVRASREVFTVHLDRGAKKSLIVDDPATPLIIVLQKICMTRSLKMSDMKVENRDGNPVDLQTPLGQIPGKEVIFVTKESDQGEKPSVLPPFIDDVKSSQAPTEDIQSSKSTKIPLMKKLSITAKKKYKIEKKKDGDELTTRQPNVDPFDDEAKKRRCKQVMDLYEIGEVLGNGAFSVVKVVKNRETGQEYAMKIVSKKGQTKSQRKRFLGEIEVMASLHHPNIVQFMEIVEDSKAYYVLMELVRGGELFDQIVAKGRFTEEEAAPLLVQILNALVYLHEVKHCVHRDLKPENLLYRDKKYKELKIADFGEAKNFQKQQLSTYCGTPDYMAPEIIKSLDHGPPADMWSLGVVAYVMIGGFPPFAGQTDVEVFDSIMNCRFSFPSPEWNEADLSKDFISKLLVVDPNNRMSALEALDHPFLREKVSLDLSISNEGIKRLRWGEITEDFHLDTTKKKKKKPPKVLKISDDFKLDKLKRDQHKITHEEATVESPVDSPKIPIPKPAGVTIAPEEKVTIAIDERSVPSIPEVPEPQKSPRHTTRITRGHSQPRPRKTSSSAGLGSSDHGRELTRTFTDGAKGGSSMLTNPRDRAIHESREDREERPHPLILNYNYDMAREKLSELRDVLGTYITTEIFKISDLEFLAGYSHTVMTMRSAIYAYSPTSTDLKNDFDYKGLLEAITGYMKFLLKNFGQFPSPDAKATLLKSFDGMIRIAIAFIDTVHLVSTVTPAMEVLQVKWETMLNIAGNVVLQSVRDGERDKQRMKKIRAILKAAILRIQAILHEVMEVLRAVPFDEVEYRRFLGALVDIYNRVQPVLIPTTKNMLIQVTRSLLIGSKYLANAEQTVTPERRCFIEKQIMQTIKILLLAKYDNLALDEIDHPDLYLPE